MSPIPDGSHGSNRYCIVHLRRSEATGEPASVEPGQPAAGDRQPAPSPQQTSLLLPLNGKGRRAAADDIATYTPPADLIDWAWKEYGVVATADSLLGSFRDQRPRGTSPPADLDAAFREFIRREFKNIARPRSTARRRRSSILAAARGQMTEWAS
jgi:hypothetical protein